MADLREHRLKRLRARWCKSLRRKESRLNHQGRSWMLCFISIHCTLKATGLEGRQRWKVKASQMAEIVNKAKICLRKIMLARHMGCLVRIMRGRLQALSRHSKMRCKRKKSMVVSHQWTRFLSRFRSKMRRRLACKILRLRERKLMSLWRPMLTSYKKRFTKRNTKHNLTKIMILAQSSVL